MAHPFTHAESSARKFDGKAEDYLATHPWFDESKAVFTNFRHRAAAANRNPEDKSTQKRNAAWSRPGLYPLASGWVVIPK